MTNKPKDIRQYVGDDGEFLYPIDEYMQGIYHDWSPPTSESEFKANGSVRFSAEYLDYLENHHEVFVPTWYEKDSQLTALLIVVGCIGLSILLCIGSIGAG